MKHRPMRCTNPAGGAALADGREYGRQRQVVELPDPRPVVTEHQLIAVQCAGCGQVTEPQTPEWVSGRVHYGTNVKAGVVYARAASFGRSRFFARILETKSMSKGTSIVMAICLLLGGIIGWVIGGRFDPSHKELRAAAEELVPEGALVTARGENTGHPIVSGAYFTTVEFQLPAANPSEVDAALDQRSRRLGYSTQRVEVFPGATVRDVLRRPMQARLRALTTLSPPGHGQGTIRVEADPESKRDRRIMGAVAGSVSISGLILLTVAWREGYKRRTSPRKDL